MTKAKMLETLQEEYNNCMRMYDYFCKINDKKHADNYWRSARQTERIIHMLFGDNIRVYDNYLATL